MSKNQATSIVESFRGVRYTDQEICVLIGISKPTLYKRLREHNWKKGELLIIKSLLK